MTDCIVKSFLHKIYGTKNTEKVLELNISTTIQDFKEEWNSLEITDVFFQFPYLSVMEQYGSPTIDNYFVIIKDNGNAIGAFLFQLTEFDLKKRIATSSNGSSLFKKIFAEKSNYKILVHGNLYQSGNHMNFFKDQNLTTSEKAEYVLDAMEEMSQYLYNENILVETLLVKDMDQGEKKSFLLQDDGKYSSFCVDPNMILDLKPQWNNIDDYLAELRSKYRVRYRKARLDQTDLRLQELYIDDMIKYRDTMYDLYVNTATDSGFNIGLFKKDYFLKLKQKLNENCTFYGYFDGEKLIAFYSAIKNSDVFSAHYLGFDNKYNNSHKLYLNILYDLVEKGIASGLSTLNFSRTALEIKSTVGAEPHELHCYIRMDSHIKNKLLPLALKRYMPKIDWVKRSPFKTL